MAIKISGNSKYGNTCQCILTIARLVNLGGGAVIAESLSCGGVTSMATVLCLVAINN